MKEYITIDKDNFQVVDKEASGKILSVREVNIPKAAEDKAVLESVKNLALTQQQMKIIMQWWMGMRNPKGQIKNFAEYVQDKINKINTDLIEQKGV